MRVFHRHEADAVTLKQLLEKNNIEAPCETTFSREEIREAYRKHKGPGIGGDPGFVVDLGRSLYTFVLSEEFAEMLAKQAVVQTVFHGIIAPLYKKLFTKKNDRPHSTIKIVTDGYEEFPLAGYEITFSLESGLGEQEVEEALSLIPVIRERLLKLLEFTNFSGHELIELVYIGKVEYGVIGIGGKWSIQRFDRCGNSATTSSETLAEIEKIFPPQKPSILLRVRNFFRRLFT